MLQHRHDLFEPDGAAQLAIENLFSGADTSTAFDKAQLLSGQVREQFALYHREMLAATRKRRSTISVGNALDAGGLQMKQADGRLPKDVELITAIKAQLWQQVWSPLWLKVVELTGL
jgi:hypothetical protein